jgi:hypothetical protein
VRRLKFAEERREALRILGRDRLVAEEQQRMSVPWLLEFGHDRRLERFLRAEENPAPGG